MRSVPIILLMWITTKEELTNYEKVHRCRYCDDIGSYNIVYTYQVLTLFFIPVWKWNKTYFAETNCCHKQFILDRAVGDMLRNEGYEYISSRYDLKKVKKIYISGDGASWIRESLNYFKQAVFVMDEYHILKYTIKATSVLQDSQEEGVHRIFVALRNNDKTKLENIFGMIFNVCQTDKEKETINECYKYFMDQFESICLRFQKNEEILGCSAEGHVSHILSNRLSSRPMGWSIKGCNNISKFIAYH